ncbi:MAG: ABC transporter ATP-binding protein [Chloroflexi bacterium]|nr:ABC transporter ATP-binding protein [Chloroflexota bacterium]MCY4247547.1 ABC transporter ATP-binding protein [Chloroflexota bacterium]
MTLNVHGLRWSVAGRRIIDDIQLSVETGAFVGLLGPNGSGKSTLLRCIYRSLKPDAGSISLDGADLLAMPPRDAARKMAVVLQETPVQFDFTVQEMVLMGRTPHKSAFDPDTSDDWEIVVDALAQVDMLDFRERSYGTLSGGEKQRVLIARALAQQSQFMVLDEPTNHLDIRYQLEILDIVRELPVTTLAALHDLNLAALYCDRLYVLSEGHVVASGAPDDIVTADLIYEVYGVRANVATNPTTGKRHITYFPARVRASA